MYVRRGETWEVVGRVTSPLICCMIVLLYYMLVLFSYIKICQQNFNTDDVAERTGQAPKFLNFGSALPQFFHSGKDSKNYSDYFSDTIKKQKQKKTRIILF